MTEPHGLDEKAKSLVSTPRKGRRSVPWQRDPEILARLELVSAMLLRGATVRQIAETLDCSISTAKRDKKRVEKLWLEATQEQIEEGRARSIAQLREVQARAWAQYDNKPSPRYLRIVVECEKEVVALEGTRSAVNVDVTSRGKELHRLTAEDLSDDELAAIAARGGPGAASPEAGPS